MTNWKELADSWKSAAEANDRSYRVAYEALEQTREQLNRTTISRDHVLARLKLAEAERDKALNELKWARQAAKELRAAAKKTKGAKRQ